MTSPSAAPALATPAVFTTKIAGADLTVERINEMVADLAGSSEFPNDRDALLARLADLTAATKVFALLEAATHEVIAAAVWHGQKVMPANGHGKVTQEAMAIPLDVTGPRVNAIMKRAAEAHGPAEA